MNERIKELAKKAGNLDMIDKVWGDAGPPIKYVIIEGNSMYSLTYLEKFAELIVRECARVIDRGDGAMCSLAETTWCNICRDHILNHFGVEE